jgi:DNA invertase Pin-like site-specific DNA recombinase
MNEPELADQGRKRTEQKADAGSKARAIGYTRVSTDEQVLGNGLEVQEDAIRRYCKDQGLRLIAVERDEGISGSNGLDARLGLASSLARVEGDDADCLVVYRLDRLARDFVLQELLVNRLRERGKPIHSVMEPDIETVTNDPTKVLIRQIIGAIGQYERALIRGRMQAGKLVKEARGGYVGGQPGYGYRADQRELIDDPEESEVVRMVLALRAAGSSYRAICESLADAGYRPRRARTWHPMVARSIVQRHER